MSWSSLPGRTRARLRLACLQRDGYRCQLKLEGCTTIATTADHIVDRAVAGDGLDNLRAACAWCNGSRGKPGRHDPEPRSGGWV
jgi:5-methylcytosine-specific restriction endonuclease McrA